MTDASSRCEGKTPALADSVPDSHTCLTRTKPSSPGTVPFEHRSADGSRRAEYVWTYNRWQRG